MGTCLEGVGKFVAVFRFSIVGQTFMSVRTSKFSEVRRFADHNTAIIPTLRLCSGLALGGIFFCLRPARDFLLSSKCHSRVGFTKTQLTR